MGWSHSVAAGRVMDVWSDACFVSTNSQNSWKDENGVEYFWETSRTEHEDGAVTGRVFKVMNNLAYPSGTFRINGDGSIARAPKFLKNAVAVARNHKRI